MDAYNNSKEKQISASTNTLNQVPSWKPSAHRFLDVDKIGSDFFKKNNP